MEGRVFVKLALSLSNELIAIHPLGDVNNITVPGNGAWCVVTLEWFGKRYLSRGHCNKKQWTYVAMGQILSDILARVNLIVCMQQN